MADYISRDDALLHSEILRVYTKDYGNIDVVPVEYLADIPAADVQPIKHGRWECVGHDDKTYWYRCSTCGHEEHDNMTKHDKYCSSCGARMDAEPDEPWQSE